MDIEYLLFLQQLREVTAGVFDGFFSYVTKLGEGAAPFIALCILYLCVSKVLGLYVMMGWTLTRVGNGFTKITACVYRPWIRDPRVKPVESAIAAATGYSFPSGHTSNAMTIYGGLVMRKDLPKMLRIGLATVVVLVGFSRNWLGVHTPQDVLVALAMGFAFMLVSQKVFDMLDAYPNRDTLVASVGMLLALALLAYTSLKHYPTDYDAAGNLIVDPAKMANDSYKNAGYALGFFVGWIIEKRYVCFSVEGTVQQRIRRGLWAVLGLLVVYYPLTAIIKLIIAGGAGSFVTCALLMLYITLIAPILIKRLEGQARLPGANQAPEEGASEPQAAA